MEGYTVSRLAELAGVSVRTLHHYDRIGLLEPGSRTDAGYRIYNRREVDRLQQILFYRELEIPLGDIREILDASGFNPAAALRDHRSIIRERMARLRRQEVTITKTLKDMASKETTMKDNDRFSGIGEFDHAKYRDEAMEKFGERHVKASEERMAGWSDGQKAANFKAGEDIARELALLVDGPADAPEAVALARRQYDFVNMFWDCNLDAFRGMGNLYSEDERFAAYYERFAPGLAGFFRDVIHSYVNQAESGD